MEAKGDHPRESMAGRPKTAVHTPWRYALFFAAVFIILFLLLWFVSFTLNILVVISIAFAALLLVVVIGALQLRHERALSEKGFITLVRLVVRNAKPELFNKLSYASLASSVILTFLTLDPAFSLSPCFWIVPFLAGIGLLISLHSFLKKRQDFLRTLWHLAAVCFAGLAAVLWSRYISALASIVTEVAIAGTIGLGYWLRKSLIARYGRYRRLAYLGLIVCTLVPAMAVIPLFTEPSRVVVSPTSKFIALDAGGTRTLSIDVASVYGDAWNVRLTAESPKLIAVYLDTREKGPLEIQYLQKDNEQRETMRVETSPQITNGTYDIKVNFEYTDAWGKTHQDSTGVQVLVGLYAQPRPCIISTVTFGSEVSPAVQFLRNFRDHLVLSTKAGSAFMTIFNNWYYSFSPAVAEMIAPSDQLRTVVRISLYPLLGILAIGTWVFSVPGNMPELSVVVTGLFVSSLTGLVYLTPLAFLFLRKRRRIREFGLVKGYFGSLGAALLLLMAGEFADLFLLLAIGSCTLVLSNLVLVPVIVGDMIAGGRQGAEGETRTTGFEKNARDKGSFKLSGKTRVKLVA